MIDEDYLEQSLSHIDVTDRIDEYAHGKTFECNCGQGIGVGYHVRSVRCAKCGRVCVDTDAEDREPTEQDGEAGVDGEKSSMEKTLDQYL